MRIELEWPLGTGGLDPRGAARRIISMRYANEREIAKYTPALG